ncbi:MAG: penicillin-binding protein 2 [Patescibacteria group bacterium]
MFDNRQKNIFGLEIEGAEAKRIAGRYKNSWIENAFHFESIQGRNIPLPQTPSYIGCSVSKKKLAFVLINFVIFFSIIFFRIFYLQLINGDNYRLLAESNREKIVPIQSERGLIFDRNGAQLTKNIPKFSLALIPQELPRDRLERERIVKKLAQLTNQDIEAIRAALDEFGSYSYESIVIKENLDYDTALSIQIDSADLPGIHIQRGSKRLYLGTASSTDQTGEKNLSLSHVIGYQGKLNVAELDLLYDQGYLPSDYIGKNGLEKIYESSLRGKYGRRRIEVNALGKEQSVIAEDAPKPGMHLKLTVDVKIQDKLEQIIKASLKLNNKSRAVAVALDPSNGEILALISIPAFNNNDFSGGIAKDIYLSYINNEDRPLFNRALGGTYPSGSTIKPAIAASALQEGIIDKDSTFLSAGGIRIADWFFPDWQAGGHGETNVTKALAWSVNTFFYYIGGGYNDFVGLGVDRINQYLRKFGFASQLGIDLPSEAAGFVSSKEWKEKTKGERWYIGDTYNLSIGQGDILVTPLQIASMTAAIANGGTLYKPHVVQSIIDPLTEQENKIQPEKIRTGFINSGNIEIVRQGMRECVIYGSCRRLSSLPFETAGKTGTAQWSSSKDNHAWYTSFAPYLNPKIVVTILIEEGGEGSGIAVPIAEEFYRWWWKYLNF